MNKCIDYAELISAYADGELNNLDTQIVNEHLKTCENCSALLNIYKEIPVSMDESIVQAPEALRIGVMNRIHVEAYNQKPNASKPRKRYNILFTRYAPIAACLVVGILVWQFWGDIWGARNDAAITGETLRALTDTAAPAPEATAPEPDAAPAVEEAADAGVAAGGGEDVFAEFAEESEVDSDFEDDFGSIIPSAFDSIDDLMMQSLDRTDAETERIMEYISNSYAQIAFTGDLPAMLADLEPQFGFWFGWEMVFEIPSESVERLLEELGIREGMTIAFNDNESEYSLVMYSR